MRTIKSLVVIALMLCAIYGMVCCNDKFYKDKYDVALSITNKTDTIIREAKIDGAKGAKVWVFKNIQPGRTEVTVLNIKRELKVSEGGFIISAMINNQDTISISTGYFTNWSYQGPIPASFNIYRDSIAIAK